MKSFQKPYAIVEKGEIKFVLFDGTKTKSVSAFCEFDNSLGVFTILDNNEKVVEYMDILGNFSKQPTNFAKNFNDYINSTKDGVGFGNQYCFLYCTSLIDFHSKYLANKKIRQIVKQEEKFKFVTACKSGKFNSLFGKLRYRIYMSKIFNQKMDKMKNSLNKQSELENKEYFEL